ncbi:hypothetical protein TL16_g08257 [Triparma laevis f. inornata]|uniref:Cyclic nucleotide-binding domain-containing protein n=1 Tax=Triparma laevis f. inornata TaxID=1714386 RepID=A0A9W7B4I1_9STRA|nr:hypothetical protein TL16_g08257 [Triparma laevis f. inornata]
MTTGRNPNSLDAIDAIAKMSMQGAHANSPVQKFGRKAKIDKFGSFDENDGVGKEEVEEKKGEEKKEEVKEEVKEKEKEEPKTEMDKDKPEMWNIDGTEMDLNAKYKTGGQLWYLQDRALGAIKAGEEIAGEPMSEHAKTREAERREECGVELKKGDGDGDGDGGDNDEDENNGEEKLETTSEVETKPNPTNPNKPPPFERKGSIRLRSVRRESLDNNENEKLMAKRASQEHGDDSDSDGSDDSSNNGEEEEEGGGERRRSISSGAAEVFRKNSYAQAIDTFHLSKYYKEAMARAQEKGGEAAKTWTPKQRWLNAIHTVLRGVRAVNAFLPQAYKKRKDEKKAAEKKKDAWHSVKKTAVQQAVQNRMAMEFKVDSVENTKSVGFAFGKSADRQLFENCLNILKMEHKKRSRPDVVMLLSLLKGNAFFSKLEYEVKLELASVMNLSNFKEGQNVFKQGDVGNLFFIVLQGEVDVFVTHMGIQFKACTYNVGGSFGERALLTSEPRAATCTCTEDSDFLVIGRRDYLRVLRDVHERESLQKIQFLKTVRYFDMLPGYICEEIAQKFQKKRYGRNEIIIREGDKHTHLHIIRTGESRVLKKVKLGGETVHLETRHLSSRDFFGQEDKSVNQFSVLSLSFAEVYSCHVNDLKNIERPELHRCIQDMKAFALKFDHYNNEETLKEVFKKQNRWEERKSAVMKDLMEYRKSGGGGVERK